jgi:UDP-N-acetylmuramoyl-L-alanyl-D-glutamate--2,6-diaminopimelate ligase
VVKDLKPQTINHKPATSNKQPATSNQQPATSNQQPATSNQQPVTSNKQEANMKLNSMLAGTKYDILRGSDDVNIKGIAYDSRKVKKGFAFVCVKGMVTDGHKYIESAIKNGADAIIIEDDIEKDIKLKENINIIQVSDTRNILAKLADSFYGHPSGKLKIIGITGTKGKTTTTFMLKNILEAEGYKVGLIGTIHNMIGDEILYTERTTPESLDLNAIFSSMLKKGCDICVMEVSSQGLMLDRVAYIDFELAVFTNISQAHIGKNEHKDFDDYLNCKVKLFSMAKKSIINIDNEYSKLFIEASKGPVTTFGIKYDADVMAKYIKSLGGHEEFSITTEKEKFNVHLDIPGLFSVYNALTAATIAMEIGIDSTHIRTSYKNVHVPGRVEKVNINKGYTVIIDYAHSPDSLENILIAMNDVKKGNLICMFGCGGDRDNKMRPMMGEISGELADFTVITTDNPRTEDPDSIIDMIEEGIKKTKGRYIRITNRYDAIKYCLENAKKDDLIILAGKGHETYQTFKDKTIHFDEREVVHQILKNMNREQ